jgi:hypothetical protein
VSNRDSLRALIIKAAVSLSLLAGLFAAGCYQFNNPLDPNSPNYQGSPSDQGWLDGWNYRKRLQIDGSPDQTVTNYAMRIVAHFGAGSDSGEHVYLGGHCRSDFGDLRFTDRDSEEVYDYWIRIKIDGDEADLWIEVPTIHTSDGAVLYLYYGNASAASQSDGEATFPVFDDFEKGSIDPAKWSGSVAPLDPDGWYVTAGIARCDSSGKILYNDTQIADLNLFASIAVLSMGDGYLGVRCTDLGSPITINDRYDLLLNRSAGYVKLRVIDAGSEYGVLDESIHSFVSDFFLSGISAVGDAAGGDNISARVDSPPNGPTILSGGDSSYVIGGVCLGTADTNSGSVYVDWVAARKRVNPEPTVHQWGEEQTE